MYEKVPTCLANYIIYALYLGGISLTSYCYKEVVMNTDCLYAGYMVKWAEGVPLSTKLRIRLGLSLLRMGPFVVRSDRFRSSKEYPVSCWDSQRIQIVGQLSNRWVSNVYFEYVSG